MAEINIGYWPKTKSRMNELLIVATSGLKPEQEASLIDSPYPRVEYVMLAQKLGADFLNYELYSSLLLNQLIRRFETFVRSDVSLALATLKRAKKYKTVLAMSERVGILLAFAKKFRLLKSKLILRFTAWSPRQENLFKRLKLLPFIDHIIVESQPLHDLLIEEFEVEKQNISFVPYSIDVDYFDPQKASALTKCKKTRLFSAGEVRGRDYLTLIKAVESMEDVEIEIAASGTWFAREKHDQLDIDLPANVSILGRRPHSAMRESYAEADCVVIPLRDEVFSAGVTVALEALSMGKPVIATKSKGLASYLVEGETCLLVPPNEPEALRQAIKRVMNDPELANRLGKNARLAAEEQFHLEKFVSGIESVIALSSTGE